MAHEKQDIVIKKPGEQRGTVQKIMSPFSEMERMFDDLFHRRFMTPSWLPNVHLLDFGDISPSIDMFEEGDDLIIKAEIPGMNKEEISIDFADNFVTISGEKKSEDISERKDYYRVERSFGSFSRKLKLPVEIQIDKTRAQFKEGVLEIRMPKSEEARQKVKKIKVE